MRCEGKWNGSRDRLRGSNGLNVFWIVPEVLPPVCRGGHPVLFLEAGREAGHAAEPDRVGDLPYRAVLPRKERGCLLQADPADQAHGGLGNQLLETAIER